MAHAPVCPHCNTPERLNETSPPRKDGYASIVGRRQSKLLVLFGRFSRSAAGPQRRFQSQLGGRGLLPTRCAKGGIAQNRHFQSPQFFIRHGPIDEQLPVARACNGPFSNSHFIAFITPPPQAAPSPVFRLFCLFCAQGGRLDVSANRQHWFAFLHRECLESPPIYGPAARRAMHGVPALCMGNAQKTHKLR